MSDFGKHYARVRAAYIAGWIDSVNEPRPFKSARESMAKRYLEKIRTADDAETEPDDDVTFIPLASGSAVTVPWTEVPLFTDEEKTFVRQALGTLISEKTKHHLGCSVAFDRPYYVRAYEARIAEIDRMHVLHAAIDKKIETITFVPTGDDVQAVAR